MIDVSSPANLETRADHRHCVRNDSVCRGAFVNHARQLLPNLDEPIEIEATRLYGPEMEGALPTVALRHKLETTLRFYQWFSEGKQAEFVVPSEIVPDGEISAQFARCWQAAAKATPELKPKFLLRKDGFQVPLPHGYYRFNRSVLLAESSDDGSDVTIAVDPALLRKGGLFRMDITDDGVRLQPLGTAFRKWKLALRILRRYRQGVRVEIMRRLRAGVPFEFSRHRAALKVTLKSGRMPTELKQRYEERAQNVNRRLQRVSDACAALELEAQRAAEKFAAKAEILAAQRASELTQAIGWFRDTRARLWQIAQVSYRKDSLPEWPFRSPLEIRGWAKRGLSSRQRMRLENAIEWFTKSYNEVVALGWDPAEDSTLIENKAVPQQILALDYR